MLPSSSPNPVFSPCPEDQKSTINYQNSIVVSHLPRSRVRGGAAAAALAEGNRVTNIILYNYIIIALIRWYRHLFSQVSQPAPYRYMCCAAPRPGLAPPPPLLALGSSAGLGRLLRYLRYRYQYPYLLSTSNINCT